MKGNCRSCGAPVLYVHHATTKQLQVLNATPVETGKLQIRGGKVHSITTLEPADESPRYISHFTTCPQAKQWRKKERA